MQSPICACREPQLKVEDVRQTWTAVCASRESQLKVDYVRQT